MDSISRGVLGLGLGNVIAGLAGGLGLSTSTGNVGLSVATGATSRVLAFFAGGILIALAFLPKAAAIFVLAPQPVLAACLIFVTMFMIVAGIQMINSRMLDARRTFVIGLALSFGLSVNTLPALYNSLPAWVRPFTASSLTLAALLAVVINAVFRLGVAKSADLPLLPGDSAREKISRFMEDRGSQWGARRDVIQRAIASAVAVADALRTDNLARDRVILTASFDEFDLGLSVRYSGHSWSAPAEQAGSLADEVRSESINDACSIRLHFVH
jgi:NCS2 family nucleobase:cation symporter-2